MRLLTTVTLSIAAMLLAFAAVSASRAEAAGNTAKFAVDDYRITLDGDDPTGPLVMNIHGKASAHGNEYLPFQWKVPDARAYLPILQTCANGKLMGQVRLSENRDDKPIKGEGMLSELSCKMVLK